MAASTLDACGNPQISKRQQQRLLQADGTLELRCQDARTLTEEAGAGFF